MKVYTARQAIFNRQQNVVAYELLFRDGPENFFPDVDAHEATSKLIMRTHLNQGLSIYSENKPVLINFGQASLESGLPSLLPKNKVMIEILEDVEPSDEVFELCRELFHQGYHIALDDFVYKPEWKRFFKFIKLIKFDIMRTPIDDVAPLIPAIKKLKRVKILAEKVETKAEFEACRKLGFDYYQGYFFCKPEIKERNDVEGNPHVLMMLYKEIAKQQLNVESVSLFFEQDVSLTYKLLRFINSGVMPLTQEITSIKQALIYLGEAQTRKLIALLVTSLLTEGKPRELLRIAIVRAKHCELVCTKRFPGQAELGFLTGLFSLLDAILDSPMCVALTTLPLSDEIVLALTEDECQNPLAISLRAICYFEQGQWYNTQRESSKIQVEYDELAAYYQDALSWAQQFEPN
ncbi:HDOD domain-containing protein [Catenovulum sp. SM1970]|uniref:EAL and HDOD domain-containing protein n=1 Tax=Marinifaba aquimaris TaxID=2741323 RepID=UPI00157432A8|nr:HDOD domain-containing protein [Marinifaba aquimaris]NTS75598.1 HDOD domain-containing protein [Marinifaba aquimaris]